jgi:hypothetical protein
MRTLFIYAIAIYLGVSLSLFANISYRNWRFYAIVIPCLAFVAIAVNL